MIRAAEARCSLSPSWPLRSFWQLVGFLLKHLSRVFQFVELPIHSSHQTSKIQLAAPIGWLAQPTVVVIWLHPIWTRSYLRIQARWFDSLPASRWKLMTTQGLSVLLSLGRRIALSFRFRMPGRAARTPALAGPTTFLRHRWQRLTRHQRILDSEQMERHFHLQFSLVNWVKKPEDRARFGPLITSQLAGSLALQSLFLAAHLARHLSCERPHLQVQVHPLRTLSPPSLVHLVRFQRDRFASLWSHFHLTSQRLHYRRFMRSRKHSFCQFAAELATSSLCWTISSQTSRMEHWTSHFLVEWHSFVRMRHCFGHPPYHSTSRG